MDLRLINTFLGIIILYTITAMPFVFIAVSAGWRTSIRGWKWPQLRRRKHADLVVGPRSHGFFWHSVGRAVRLCPFI